MTVTNRQELEELIQQVKKAQQQFANYSQEQVDLIFKKAALLGIWAVPAMVASFIHPRLGLLALIIYLPLSNTFALSVVRVFQVVGNFIGIEPSYALYKIAKDAFYFAALAAILIKTKTFKQLRPKIKPFLITALILLDFPV